MEYNAGDTRVLLYSLELLTQLLQAEPDREKSFSYKPGTGGPQFRVCALNNKDDVVRRSSQPTEKIPDSPKAISNTGDYVSQTAGAPISTGYALHQQL